MYRLLFLLILLPGLVDAQSVFERQRLNILDSYHLALRDYIRDHPGDIVGTKTGKALFVRKAPFISNYRDTLSGVEVRFVDTDSADASLGALYPKKQSFNILHLQQMMLRDLNAFIWIMPMKTTYDPKKSSLKEPEYTGLLCEYVFDYTPDKNIYYLFKTSTCRE